MRSPSGRASRLVSAAWRISLAVLPLGAGLALATVLLLATDHPSGSETLVLRIVAGLTVSAVALTVIALLVRVDGRRMRDVGLTNVRTGWRMVMWGAVVWTVPAAATFALLALLGTPLTVTVGVPELVRTVLLLALAVLLSEAIPEEAVFRGYVTTALGALTRGWAAVVIQALLFTLFAALLRQDASPADLSLFLTMGIIFGYLRMVTGSVWMPIGFHVAFQTGAQLVLTHDAIEFAGGAATAMLALGVIPFSVAAIVVSTGAPRVVRRIHEAGSKGTSS